MTTLLIRQIQGLLESGKVLDQHVLTLEVALDRIEEGLSMTPKFKLIMIQYAGVLKDLRLTPDTVRKDRQPTGRKQSAATKAKRARSMRLAWVKRKAEIANTTK